MAIKKEVKTGIVVTVALCLLIYGLNFLKGINVFSHSKKVYAVYSDVVGIVPSNPVLVNGFSVGQVKKIELRPDASGKIVITILISNTDVKIPKSSVAKIVSDGILGSKAIQIVLGKDNNSYVEDGDTLASEVGTSLKDEVNREIQPVKQKAEELMSSIDSTLAIVQGVFTKDVRTDLSESIVSMRNSLKHFESTAQNMDELMGSEKERISSILKKVEEISTALAKNSKQLGNAINNISNITDTIAKSNLKSTINNADSALYYTSKLLKKINAGQGSLGMLANDTALYKRLTSASGELSRLLEDLKAHPKRYVHFSIFGKKD
ncbi:MAG TPA: MlaD family protein [Bacteroidia bacterium]|nr:MlaD family protein [Bacteroidia bacterium]